MFWFAVFLQLELFAPQQSGLQTRELKGGYPFTLALEKEKEQGGRVSSPNSHTGLACNSQGHNPNNPEQPTKINHFPRLTHTVKQAFLCATKPVLEQS